MASYSLMNESSDKRRGTNIRCLKGTLVDVQRNSQASIAISRATELRSSPFAAY